MTRESVAIRTRRSMSKCSNSQSNWAPPADLPSILFTTAIRSIMLVSEFITTSFSNTVIDSLLSSPTHMIIHLMMIDALSCCSANN